MASRIMSLHFVRPLCKLLASDARHVSISISEARRASAKHASLALPLAIAETFNVNEKLFGLPRKPKQEENEENGGDK